MTINFENFLLQKITAIDIFKIFLVKRSYLVAVSKWDKTSVITGTSFFKKMVNDFIFVHKFIILKKVGGLK